MYRTGDGTVKPPEPYVSREQQKEMDPCVDKGIETKTSVFPFYNCRDHHEAGYLCSTLKYFTLINL